MIKICDGLFCLWLLELNRLSSVFLQSREFYRIQFHNTWAAMKANMVFVSPSRPVRSGFRRFSVSFYSHGISKNEQLPLLDRFEGRQIVSTGP